MQFPHDARFCRGPCKLVQVADLIVRSAHGRHEGGGLHFSRDYPEVAWSPVPTLPMSPTASAQAA